METEEYYRDKELLLRLKYIQQGVNRAKREVALERKIDELLETKKELFKFIDKLKPQKDGKINRD